MARKRDAKLNAVDNTSIEWVGGIIALPAYVTGEGEPYRPEALFWIGADGALLGSTVAEPGNVIATAGESLADTIARPQHGEPHCPTRVRVNSTELAEALRASHASLHVVVDATPEVDFVAQTLREHVEGSTPEPSYLADDVSHEAVAACFKAAATLFRAQPWERVPSDQSLMCITIEQLGLRDAALTVIGQSSESYGFILFSGLDDFEAYLFAAEDFTQGDPSELPPHFALNYERGAELETSLRKEIAEHGWEVAGPNAYPWLVSIDEDLVARPPTANEVTMTEAIALALSRVLDQDEALRAAWEGGEALSDTFSVKTHAGAIDVAVTAPYPGTGFKFRESDDILANLIELAEDEADEEERIEFEDELVRRFRTSAEGKALEPGGACYFVMDLATNHLGHSIGTLDAAGLREVLFELIPRKINVEPSEAAGIIEELRAFYRFLQREFELEQAEACLQVLGRSAPTKLEAALSDSSNFGMAKSIFMAGVEAGFDLETQEGLEAWMHHLQSQPLKTSVDGPETPSRPKLSVKASKAKKNKRKATRKARKKNA